MYEVRRGNSKDDYGFCTGILDALRTSMCDVDWIFLILRLECLFQFLIGLLLKLLLFWTGHSVIFNLGGWGYSHPESTDFPVQKNEK